MKTRMFVDAKMNGVVYFKNGEGTTIECPKGFLVLTHSGSTEETLIGPRAMMGGEILGPNRDGMAPAGLPGLPPLNSSSKYYSDCNGTGFLLSGGIMYHYAVDTSGVDQYSTGWATWIKFVPFGTGLAEPIYQNPSASAEGEVGGWCHSLSITKDPVIPEFGMTVMDFLQSIRKHNRACRAKTVIEFEESPSALLESVGFSTDGAKYNKSAKVIAIGDAELIVFEAGANLGYSDMFLVRKNKEHGWPEAWQMGQMGWVNLGHQGAQDIISKMPRGAQRYKGIVAMISAPIFIEPKSETDDTEVVFSIPRRCLGFIASDGDEKYLFGVRGRAYGFVTEDNRAVVSPQTIEWLGQTTEARPVFNLMWGIPTDFEGEFAFHGENFFLAEKRGNEIFVSSEDGQLELCSWSLAEPFTVVFGKPQQEEKKEEAEKSSLPPRKRIKAKK